MSTPDVTVLGAGIFGLSIAWACTRRGANVRVIDPHGVGAGSSGGIVGAMAPHTPENWNEKKAFQLESLLMAETFWSEIAESGGVNPGFARNGRIQPVPDARGLELAYQRATNADNLWEGKAEWRVVERDAVSSILPDSPTGFYIHDTLSARIHPRKACRALAEAIKAKGGEITEDATASGLVVEATGHAGLKSLSAEFRLPIGNGVKGQAALLDFDLGNTPQVFAETLHFIPHSDGTMAIGSTSEREFESETGTDALLDDLIDKARRILPDLASAPVLERWAGIRPRARSRAPILGPHPEKAETFIANGGFKIGFGMAPKVAQCMADLVLAGKDTVPDSFRVDSVL